MKTGKSTIEVKAFSDDYVKADREALLQCDGVVSVKSKKNNDGRVWSIMYDSDKVSDDFFDKLSQFASGLQMVRCEWE